MDGKIAMNGADEVEEIFRKILLKYVDCLRFIVHLCHGHIASLL